MFLGKVIAAAAIRENKEVSFLPAYGAEMRGGSCYCMVSVSERAIGSPYIDTPDICLLMNGVSWDKFHHRMKKGIIIVNSSLVGPEKGENLGKHIEIIREPLTEIALTIGAERLASMVGLSALLSRERIVQRETVKALIEEVFKKDRQVVDANFKAIDVFKTN